MSISTAQRRATERLQRYRDDHELYCRENLKIVDKDANVVPLEFNFPQRVVHKKISSQRKATGRVRAIVLKARQEGVSTYVASRNYRAITMLKNQNAMVIADEKKRGTMIFGMYDFFNNNIPDPMRPTQKYKTKGMQLIFDTPEGKGGMNSKITVETAMDAAAGRAATITRMHATEVAFWENAEEVWLGLNQAVPDNGSEIILESTANGVGNFFHSMWVDAEQGRNSYIAIFLPWWIDERYEQDFTPEEESHILATLDEFEREALSEGIEWEGERHILSLRKLSWRRQKIADGFMGDQRGFRQEYPSTSREAFLVSGNMFFDENALQLYEQSQAPPKWRGNLIHRGDTILPMQNLGGHLRVWRWPDPKGIYVIGGDTAQGIQVSQRELKLGDIDGERGGRDFSSADVFEVRSRSYVAQLHARIPPEVFALALVLLGRFYSCARLHDEEERAPALIGVERNHRSGETVLRLLKDTYNYPRLWYHRQINRRTRSATRTNQLGWTTNQENRKVMLDELGAALRQQGIWLPNPDTIKEMFTFVEDDTGKPVAQEGCHDDRVISAALALQLARYQPSAKRPKKDPQTFGSSPAGFMDY